MTNTLHFASKYIKPSLEKKSYKIKYGLGMKYILNTVKYAQIFAFKYLKRIFEQSHT